MLYNLRFLLIVLCLSFLTACGGDSKNSNANSDDLVKTGVFIDSPVSNLSYQTESQSGKTNESGQFKYKAGESITFKLGGILLGESEGAPTVTPSDLTHAGLASSSSEFNNMLRLLQSLDDDCNATNGIQISETMQMFSEDVNFDLSRTELEFDNDESLLNLLSKSTCATSWVSQLQADTHFRISIQEEATELLQKFALITLEGGTEPKIAVDDEGNSIYLLPGKAEYKESSVIMLQDSSGDTLHISVNNEGLPKEVIFSDGTIMILSNQTGESVDLLINSPDELVTDILLRVELNDLARLTFSLINSPSVSEVASITVHKNTHSPSLDVFDFFMSKAIAAEDASQVLSNGMKNAGSIINYLKTVGDVVSVTYSGHSKLGLLKKIGGNVIEKALLKSSLNSLGLDKDQQRVADLSFSALTCSGALNLAGCGKLAFDSAAVTIELGGLIADWYNDRDRINALEKQLKNIDFDSHPPVVKLDYSNSGKKFPIGESITFSATAIDPDEGSILPENLSWNSLKDGDLGTGESITTSNLSPGLHVITVTAISLDGQSKTSRLSIEIANAPPVVTASTASSETTYAVGDTIIFTGTAVDPEGEELLVENLEWHTSLGNTSLGYGNTVVVEDLAGPESDDPEATRTHTITFSARDSYDEVGSDSINVTISNAPPPTIIITTTETNYSVDDNSLITATAENYLGETLEASSIVWSIEGSGVVGFGNTFSIAQLEEGTYTLTATVTDEGLSSAAEITVTLNLGIAGTWVYSAVYVRSSDEEHPSQWNWSGSIRLNADGSVGSGLNQGSWWVSSDILTIDLPWQDGEYFGKSRSTLNVISQHQASGTFVDNNLSGSGWWGTGISTLSR
jgi:hypothetical protein